MRIEENRVYVFSFNVGDHGDLAIPVRGETREAAAARLQSMFNAMQTELAMEFPVIMNATMIAGGAPSVQEGLLDIQAGSAISPVGIPPEVLEMRIDTLLADLGAAGLTDTAKANTVKKWTGLDFNPINFPAIVNKLEMIATGQEESEPPAPKGKKK